MGGSVVTHANQSSIYVACSCALTSIGYDFGFNASFVRVSIFAGKPAYLTFQSSVASTSDHFVSTGESFASRIPVTRNVAWITTASGAEISILALGD
ncbi:MAG: hypothetical protein NUW22_12630 [Acidobacteria bacterium]|nr:hypothetical protein [Acidobacteriota bacterium]